MKRLDLTGRTFGRWSVVAPAKTRVTPGGTRKAYWHCRCECGTVEDVRAEHLRSGRSSSCGCWKREAAAIQKQTHGGRHTLLYDVWTQMLQRCENPKNKAYRRYGGRGIKVCGRWHDFAAFQEDAAAFYAPGLTIDREDNDGDYEPGNVRWVSNKVNNRNRPSTVMVEWEGRHVALNELAERYGIKPHTLYVRVKRRGVDLPRALGVKQ